MARPPRDSQRAKVYAAETSVEWARHDRLILKRFRTIVDAELFAESVFRSPWFASRAPHLVQLTVVAGERSSKRATCTTKPGKVPGTSVSRIRLPPWARNRQVVLHELAHAMVWRPEPPAHHGPEFCRALIELVTEYASSSAAGALRVQFALRGVRVGAVIAPIDAVAAPQIFHGQLSLPGLGPVGQRAATTH